MESQPIDFGDLPTSDSGQGQWLRPIHDTLNTTLHGDISAEDAASILTSPSQWSDDPDLTLEDYAYLLFGACVDKALKVPPGHPSQQRLIRLLQCIQAAPAPPDAEPEDGYWDLLPSFLLQISEAYNAEGLFESQHEPDTWDKRMSKEEWRNLHGFLAVWNESQAEEDKSSFHHKVLVLLRHVLETPRKTQTLNQNFPALSVCILITARQLWVKCQASEELEPRNETRLRHSQEVELYNGPDAWTVDRWNFWVERLGQLKLAGGLDEDAREAARQAYCTMVAVQE
jgi:hypothetical protein